MHDSAFYRLWLIVLASNLLVPSIGMVEAMQYQAAEGVDADPWRRTSSGWERLSQRSFDEGSRELPAITRVHPAVVITFQILVCVALYLYHSLEAAPISDRVIHDPADSGPAS